MLVIQCQKNNTYGTPVLTKTTDVYFGCSFQRALKHVHCNPCPVLCNFLVLTDKLILIQFNSTGILEVESTSDKEM